MASKGCYEALDRTLRELLSSEKDSKSSKPFGGITVALGWDFRQLLPVLKKGSIKDIINATIKGSYLWKHFEIINLTENMRLLYCWEQKRTTKIKGIQ
ncbi:unnamed protein product [Urochloa humidicola]